MRSGTFNLGVIAHFQKEIDAHVEDRIAMRLQAADERRKTKNMDFFEMVPFFKDKLNRRERDELKRSLVPCSYKAGDIIFNYRKCHIHTY